VNDEKKPNEKAIRILISLIAVIFIISVILTVISYQKPTGQRVFVIQDNQVIYELYPESEKDREIRIDFPDGGYNIIQIQNHEIRISEADCPDLTCVKTGVLRSETLPIVCLPHRLIIRYAEEGETA